MGDVMMHSDTIVDRRGSADRGGIVSLEQRLASNLRLLVMLTESQSI